MTGGQITALALAAILVFWMLGAYNRTVALRNDIGAAWAKVDEALRQRSEAAVPLLAALNAPLAAEQGALEVLQAARAEVQRAATLLGAGPVVAAHAAAWLAAESALAAAASRVFSLLEQHAELRSLADVVAGSAAWRDAEARLAFARRLFNEAAETYDAAIGSFPTRLLVPVFGFDRAGRI